MAKETRENLKEKFKRGMFPSEGDYHNVLDSYFHKDDGLNTDNIKSVDGSKTLTEILANIDIPKLPEDLDTFIEKVNSFLEDADASDTTINKWQEIESFLAGINDTETLTGLLADLKQEILDEIPEQKEYTAGDGISISDDGVISATGGTATGILRIDDLDASDAAVGTIALYGGATNDKYTHGFFYEKGEGEGFVLKHIINNQTYYSELNANEHTKDRIDWINTGNFVFAFIMRGYMRNVTDFTRIYDTEGGYEHSLYVDDSDNIFIDGNPIGHYEITGSYCPIVYDSRGRAWCITAKNSDDPKILIRYNIEADFPVFNDTCIINEQIIDTVEQKTTWTALNVMNVIG